jgi:hypothetical protein
VPAGPDVIRVPGGAPVAIALGVLGFGTTAAAIGLALIPPESEPNKPLAVLKVAGLTLAMVLSGALVYAAARRRR